MTLSCNLTKFKEKLWQSSISHCIFRKQTYLKVKTTAVFRINNMDKLIGNCLGSHLDLSTVSLDVNYSVFLMNITELKICSKRPTDYNSNP